MCALLKVYNSRLPLKLKGKKEHISGHVHISAEKPIYMYAQQ